ncbi:MAG: hypothetical protein U0V75_04550 [Ferruginibacter sp.]
MKILLILSAVYFLQPLTVPAQNCEVMADSLKGVYEGGCKNGKASGKGTARGLCTYTGEFKNGLPDGTGTYTWQNGNRYEGMFKKGLKEGEGILYQPEKTTSDSVVTGWWKKDLYTGRYEKPYKVYSQSPRVMDVSITASDGLTGEVTIYTSTTSGGSATGADFGGGIKIRTNWGISGIDLIKGGYNFKNYSQTPGAATDILFNTTYPLKVRLKYEGEFVELELFEKKDWKIRVSIHD